MKALLTEFAQSDFGTASLQFMMQDLSNNFGSTDAVGFAFLVPRFRAAAYRAIRDRVKVQSFGTPGGMGQRPGPQRRGDPRGDVIDGDFHEIPEQPRQTKGPSGWTKD